MNFGGRISGSRDVLTAMLLLLLCAVCFHAHDLDCSAPQYPCGAQALPLESELGRGGDISDNFHVFGLKTMHDLSFIIVASAARGIRGYAVPSYDPHLAYAACEQTKRRYKL